MLFQPMMLSGERCYECRFLFAKSFEPHWHFEIEILYCVSGRFSIKLGEAVHTAGPGEYIVVGSAEEHSYLSLEEGTCAFFVEFGSGLLGEGFGSISAVSFEAKPRNESVARLMRRMMGEAEKAEPDSGWIIKACLFELAAALKREIPARPGGGRAGDGRAGRLGAIYPALELIASSYHLPIGVGDAAKLAHYEKTAFCRAFKAVAGETFHKYLNIYRIRRAALMIASEGDIYTFEEIAKRCGIEQPKTFCRLFKKYNGMTPTEYKVLYCRERVGKLI